MVDETEFDIMDADHESRLMDRNPRRGPSSRSPAGYVRPIPEALYPCVHCAEDHSWPAADLNWSDLDQGWVCDLCWDDRETNWDGEDYIERDKGTSLAEEIKRQQRT